VPKFMRPSLFPNVSILFSIVAVHGLDGDAIRSWTTEPGKICWLNHPDLLPKYVKKARILTWGYNANTTSFSRRATSSERILQHAQTLVAHLSADREVGKQLFGQRYLC